MSDRDETALGDEITVAPLPEVGSQRLARALAEVDVPEIGRALRSDSLIVPQLTTPDGEEQVRVYGSDNPERPYMLYLFSSAESFSEFLRPGDGREFSITRGSSMIGFLAQYEAQLDRVVFDAAGPHPMTASAADVLLALEPQPDDETADDEVDAAGVETTETRTTSLDISLGIGWFVIDVADVAKRDEQIAELINRQFAAVKVSPALRRDLAHWLREASAKCASGGGRFLAFLLQRTDTAAVALNLTMYWHELGPATGDEPHLDRVTGQLRESMRDGEELLGADTNAGPLTRYSRIATGAAELGASDTPLLLIDYWLEFPDHRGLALLSFSSPHVDIPEHLARLADEIVLKSRWILEPA